ncbi:unnamed protein product, partial [Acanthoscelides obtectus]
KNIGAVVNKRSVVVDPDTLIICLKRVLISKYEVMKHPGLVSFPDKLQFLSSVYKLYAVVQHSGTLSQGHYIATVLLDDVRDDWIEFNDDIMTRISARPLKDAPGIRSIGSSTFVKMLQNLMWYSLIKKCDTRITKQHIYNIPG